MSEDVSPEIFLEPDYKEAEKESVEEGDHEAIDALLDVREAERAEESRR